MLLRLLAIPLALPRLLPLVLALALALRLAVLLSLVLPLRLVLLVLLLLQEVLLLQELLLVVGRRVHHLVSLTKEEHGVLLGPRAALVIPSDGDSLHLPLPVL